MHKNAQKCKNTNAFSRSQKSFCGKFKLSAGSGSQVSQLLECMPSTYPLCGGTSSFTLEKRCTNAHSRVWHFGFETSRFGNFSIFLDGIGISFKNFSIKKKYRYKFQENLVSKKVSDSVSKNSGIEKSIGFGFEKKFAIEKYLKKIKKYWNSKSLNCRKCTNIQSVQTFENVQWRKFKQTQRMWLCLFSCGPFEDTFEKT